MVHGRHRDHVSAVPPLMRRPLAPLTTAPTTSTATPQQQQALRLPPSTSKQPPLATTLVAAAAAGLLLLSPVPASSRADPEFKVYYGTAGSAANYGGDASKKDTTEYVYDVPEGWKEGLVSKVEKGTNGTDSEFFNPRKRLEREYLTFLSGIRALALSDVGLQDQIATADDVHRPICCASPKSAMRSGGGGISSRGGRRGFSLSPLT